MTTKHLNRRLATISITAAAIFGLSACAGSPTGGGAAPAEKEQTVAQACAVIADTMNDATSEFQEMSMDDMDSVIQAMDAAIASLDDASAKVTNDEVAELLPQLQEMFQKASEGMTAISEGDLEKLTEFQDMGTEFQDVIADYTELCSA